PEDRKSRREGYSRGQAGIRANARTQVIAAAFASPPRCVQRQCVWFPLVMLAALSPIHSLTAATWIVPRAVNITSLSGDHYVTVVRILNRGTSSTNVTLELIPSTGDGPPAPVTQNVDPGQTWVLPNILDSLWSLAEKTGALRVTADQPLLISTRTSN